jgi:hypothetical protein
LELEERVLCVTTIDSSLSDYLRDMYTKLRKVPNNESGKFKMIYQAPSYQMSVIDKTCGNTPKKEEKRKEKKYVFNICNSKAH